MSHDRHAALRDGMSLDAQLTILLAELGDTIVRLASQRDAVRGPKPVDSLLSVAQAAETLGISRTTIYELIRTGSIRSLKVRGRRLIPESAITDFIQARSS